MELTSVHSGHIITFYIYKQFLEKFQKTSFVANNLAPFLLK